MNLSWLLFWRLETVTVDENVFEPRDRVQEKRTDLPQRFTNQPRGPMEVMEAGRFFPSKFSEPRVGSEWRWPSHRGGFPQTFHKRTWSTGGSAGQPISLRMANLRQQASTPRGGAWSMVSKTSTDHWFAFFDEWTRATCGWFLEGNEKWKTWMSQFYLKQSRSWLVECGCFVLFFMFEKRQKTSGPADWWLGHWWQWDP